MIPVIDMASARDPVAQIDAALRDTGFFALTGHGVPVELRRAALAAGHGFSAT